MLMHWSYLFLALSHPDNVLSPVQCQTIIWTNDGLLLIGSEGTDWNFNEDMKIFIQEKEAENAVCKVATILFQSWCDNERWWWIENDSELILGLRPANERRRYKVTPSLIGWAQT